MKNFRIGDSVQILRSVEDEWGLVGQVGRVIRIDDDGMAYEVTGVGESNTDGSGWWYCEEDLCLVGRAYDRFAYTREDLVRLVIGQQWAVAIALHRGIGWWSDNNSTTLGYVGDLPCAVDVVDGV